MFEGYAEDVVRDISNVKQEIINFRKIIRPQRSVLRDLERVKLPTGGNLFWMLASPEAPNGAPVA